jgi:hypothetical protein
MKSPTISLVLVLAVGSAMLGADIDYGKPDEMHGLTRVYVDTGVDLRAHDNIVKRISKGLPKLELVEKPEDAEMILVFGQRSEQYASGVGYFGGIEYDTRDKGDGYVFRVVGKSLRIVLTDRPTHGHFFERTASAKFADGFIAAYRKANR